MTKLSPYDQKQISKSIKLYNKSKEEIPVGINYFPDTQVQVKIHKQYLDGQPLTLYISIYSSVMLDLFHQLMKTFNIKTVKINYLYGARSDKYSSGDYQVSNVAYDFCSDIERFEDVKFEFTAPHCLDYCKDLGDINFSLPDCVNLDDYDLVIYPDESAYSRYINVDKPFIICEKHRDQETGKILSHVIPSLPDSVKRVLVLDDLCDYGTTFMNLGKTLPSGVTADLFIFHGVFTDNAPIRLDAHYKNIFVSNSLPHIKYKANELHQIKTALRNTSDKLCKLVVFDVWH